MGVTYCCLGLLSTRCFFSCKVKNSTIHIFSMGDQTCKYEYVVRYGTFTIVMERDYEFKLNSSIRLFPINLMS